MFLQFQFVSTAVSACFHCSFSLVSLQFQFVFTAVSVCFTAVLVCFQFQFVFTAFSVCFTCSFVSTWNSLIVQCTTRFCKLQNLRIVEWLSISSPEPAITCQIHSWQNKVC